MINNRLQILLVDDDALDREAVTRLSKDDFDIVEATSVAQAKDVLATHKPDCILLDYRLPDAHELEHLSYFIQLGAPVVMLTGQGDEKIAVDVMKKGAKDYLPKSAMTREALKRSILNSVRNSRLEMELEQARKELVEQATVDGLTQLHNRRYFDSQLEHELAMADRTELPLSLCILDLDHFKQVNDTFGHLAGDDVLKQVACVLKNRLRMGDTACRFGGEEFALLLPATNIDQAVRLCSEIREITENFSIVYDSQPINVTVSIGVCSTQEVDGYSKDELIKKADESLYQAKEAGRNRVVAA